MEKRNTLLLTVIAIATLLVAVVGATFAYFSTTQNVAANIPVDVTTASSAAAFTAVADGDISIVVDAHEMQESDSVDTGVVNETDDGLKDDAVLTVKLNAAEAGNLSQCKYSVIYTWTSDQYCNYTDTTTSAPMTSTDPSVCATNSATMAYYHPTADVSKEFTLEATVAVEVADTTYDTTTDADGLSITASSYAQTNMSWAAPDLKSKTINTTDENGDPTTKTVYYVTLLQDEVIGSKQISDATGATNTATEVIYTFTARFYNALQNQDLLMNKTFSGTISVDPDSVEC